MSPTENKTKSRWGFHPCDYQLFVKLKYLHKWYWQSVYDFHEWHRWWRKQEQTRIGSEPMFCSVFVQDESWYKPVVRHEVSGYKVYPKTVVDHDVVDLYQKARTPQAETTQPFDEATVKKIEEIYSIVERYVALRDQT